MTIGDRTLEVELSGERILVDGQEVAAELVTLPGTPIRHLLVNGRSHTLVSQPGEAKGAWDVHINGDRFSVFITNASSASIEHIEDKDKEDKGY